MTVKPAEKPWHQKTPYAGVKDDPFELIVQNGRVTQGVNKTYTREAFEEIRVGRRCIMCDEPQLHGEMPKECSLCKFPMAEQQHRYLGAMDQGEEHVGTTIDFRAEIDRMDAELEQENWTADPMRSTGIVIPAGVKL